MRQILRLKERVQSPEFAGNKELESELTQLVKYQESQRQEFESTGSRDLEQAIQDSISLFDQQNLKAAMEVSMQQQPGNQPPIEEEKQLIEFAIMESKTLVEQQE